MKLFKILPIAILAASLFACEEDYDLEPKGEALTKVELMSPVSNAYLALNSATPDRVVTIKWMPAETGLGSVPTYKFVAVNRNSGSLKNPAISIPADNNGQATQLTLTHQQLDNALAQAGVSDNQLAELKWSILTSIPTNTSLADSFLIDIKRFGAGVGTFNLLTPPSWTQLTLASAKASENVVIDWEDASLVGTQQVTYEWQAVRRGESFDTPLITIASDAEGTASKLTLTQQQIDDQLAELGLAESEEILLQWRVKASAGGVESFSSTVNTITIARMGGIQFRLNLTQPVPAGYDVYLAGEFGFFTGSNWQQPGTNNSLKLTKESETLYTIVVPYPETTQSIAYKYFLVPTGGSSWSNGEQTYSVDGCRGLPNGAADGTDNRKLNFNTANPVNTVETVALTWEGFCDTSAPRARFVVTIPEGKPADKDVYITGSLGVVTWVQPGQAAGLRLSPVDGQANTYEIYLPVPVNQQIEFKYFLATTANPAWNGGEQKINATNNGCEGIPNRTFTFTGSNASVSTVSSWEGYCPY